MRADEILSYFNGECSGRLFWISTCDEKPHLVPVCFVKVLDGKIVVAYNFIKRTAEIVERTGKASIGFAEKGEEGFYGFLVKGRAWIDYEGRFFSEIKNFVEKITNGKRRPKGALVIEPEEIYSLKPGEGRKRIL